MKRFKFAAIAMVFTSMVNAQQELPLLEQAPFTQQELDQPPAAVLDKIEPMFQRQAKSIRYFTAPFDMIAVGVVSNDYKKQVYYTNTTGDFIVSGKLYDINSKQILNARVESELSVELPETITRGVKDAPGFTYGNGEQVIYAVVDANCGYCKKFHVAITERIDSGKLPNVTVKYIPMGMLGADSSAKAAAIMSLPESEQYAAWNAAINRQPISMQSTPEGAEKMQSIEAFFNSQSVFRGVPFVVTELNGDWQFSTGMPNPNFYNLIAQAMSAPASSPEAESIDSAAGE